MPIYFIVAAITLYSVFPTLTFAEKVEHSQKISFDSKSLLKTKFLRVKRNIDNQSESLDTAVVSYQGVNDNNLLVTVDLIAAVHVADVIYFKKLNNLFKNYEAVLYELVAPKGTKVVKLDDKKSRTSLGKVQEGMKEVLELSFQLDEIDYSRSNFVHADMSPQQFSQSMSSRGESFVKMLFKMMAQSMIMQNQKSGVTDAQIIFALMAKDRAKRLKNILAVQFESMSSTVLVFEGKNGSTIISERNNQALKILKEQVALGKTKLAIFYGAGHMQDLEKKLKADFEMDKVKQTWLSAWKLN